MVDPWTHDSQDDVRTFQKCETNKSLFLVTLQRRALSILLAVWSLGCLPFTFSVALNDAVAFDLCNAFLYSVLT